jgi:hypothetical protein
MNTRPRTPPPRPVDRQAVELVKVWLRDLTAEEVRRHCNNSSAAVRVAAEEALRELLGDDG